MNALTKIAMALLLGVAWTAAARAETADGDQVQVRQVSQQQVRSMATELVKEILDVQLQELDENGLKTLPIYADIVKMRKDVDALVETRMAKVIEALGKVQSAPAAERAALLADAREKSRQIVTTLLDERQNLLRRLQIAELAERVLQLIHLQKAVLEKTESFPNLPRDKREALVVTSIEDQRDIVVMYPKLKDTLRDLAGWANEIAPQAKDGLRLLEQYQVDRALQLADSHLRATRYPQSAESQRAVIRGLELLLAKVQNMEGLPQDKKSEFEKNVDDLKQKQQEIKNDTQPQDQKPQDQKPQDQKPQDQKPQDQKPQDQKPQDQKPQDQKPQDQKPQDQKPQDQKPQDQKPQQQQPQQQQPQQQQPQQQQPQQQQPQQQQPQQQQPQQQQPQQQQKQPTAEELEERQRQLTNEIKELENNPQTPAEAKPSLEQAKEDSGKADMDLFEHKLPEAGEHQADVIKDLDAAKKAGQSPKSPNGQPPPPSEQSNQPQDPSQEQSQPQDPSESPQEPPKDEQKGRAPGTEPGHEPEQPQPPMMGNGGKKKDVPPQPPPHMPFTPPQLAKPMDDPGGLVSPDQQDRPQRKTDLSTPAFSKLPPEVRAAIQANSQRQPPRGYEERLQRYFQAIE